MCRAIQHESTMATRNQRTLERRTVSHQQTRKSYTREYKLEVYSAFLSREQPVPNRQTILAQHQTIGRWITDEEKIKSKKASKRVNHARRCQFPETHTVNACEKFMRFLQIWPLNKYMQLLFMLFYQSSILYLMRD